MKYFITGATGHLGRMVVDQLAKLTAKGNMVLGAHTVSKAQDLKEQGYEIRAIDYSNPDQMARAFSGIDLVIYIPSLTYNVKQRIAEFENSLTAMKEAGVKSIVDVSFIAVMNDPLVK